MFLSYRREIKNTKLPIMPFYWLRICLLIIALFIPRIVHSSDNVLSSLGNYLNSFETFSADFEELRHDGERKGKIQILKPGRGKIEYLTPKKITIVLNNGNVMYYEHELDELSYIKENNYFFNLLMEKKVDISNIITDIDVDQKSKKAKIAIAKKHNNIETKGMLVFDLNPMELKEIVVQNEGQQRHHLIFHNVKRDLKISPEEFSLNNPNFYSQDYDND